MEENELKTIPRFPNYSITRDGRVWSKPRITSHGHKRIGRWLNPVTNYGYKNLILFSNLQRHTCKVHRLVLETYIGACPNEMLCRHLDGNKQNNHLGNLCWGTPSENQADRITHGTMSVNVGSGNGLAKLAEKDVRMIIYMHRTGLFLQREIAKIYQVSRPTISNIVSRETWRHVWD